LYDQHNCSDYMVEFLNFIKSDILRMNPNNRMACDSIVKQLEGLHRRCLNDEQYSCHQIKAEPKRQDTKESTLTASPINNLSAEQIKRSIRLAHDKPVHRGPVEKDLPAQDRECIRHSVIDDTTEEDYTENTMGILKGLDSEAPIATLSDQDFMNTPTSTSFGTEVHSRPQSPKTSPGKGSPSRSQSVASRTARFRLGERATSISEEHEEPGGAQHSGETSPSLFSPPAFNQFTPGNGPATRKSSEDEMPQAGVAGTNYSQEPKESSPNSTIHGDDNNESHPMDDEIQDSQATHTNQDTQSRYGENAEDTSTQNDEAPVSPPIPQSKHDQDEQNGKNENKTIKEENSQPLETPRDSTEVPVSWIERVKMIVRTKLCCG
jgi:hypothetical protein